MLSVAARSAAVQQVNTNVCWGSPPASKPAIRIRSHVHIAWWYGALCECYLHALVGILGRVVFNREAVVTGCKFRLAENSARGTLLRSCCAAVTIPARQWKSM